MTDPEMLGLLWHTPVGTGPAIRVAGLVLALPAPGLPWIGPRSPPGPSRRGSSRATSGVCWRPATVLRCLPRPARRLSAHSRGGQHAPSRSRHESDLSGAAALHRSSAVDWSAPTTFENFPFPGGLSPDIPATDYADDPRAAAIAHAARRLVELRNRWLNPSEWVEWHEEPAPNYPRYPIPRSEDAAHELRRRPLAVPAPTTRSILL